MKSSPLIQSSLSFLLALGLGLAISACTAKQNSGDSPFSSSGGGSAGASDDDDATGTTDSENLTSAWIEVTRSAIVGNTNTYVNAVASWYPSQDTMVRPDIADDKDGCVTGSADAALYGIPATSLDVGFTVLAMEGGEFVLELEGDHWTSVLPYTAWAAGSEFDVSTTGGDDLLALELAGALGTPTSIAIEATDSVETGISVSWLGGDDQNEIELRITIVEDDVLYWVACRVLDDGEYLVRAGDLAGLPAGPASIELRRRVRSEFDIVGHSPGVVVGAAVALSTVDILETAGDDDDSASGAGDDDSASP